MGFFSSDTDNSNSANPIQQVLNTLINKEQESAVTDSVFVWVKKNWWILVVIPIGMFFIFLIVKNIFSKKSKF